MTICAGIVEPDGTILLAADSAGTAGQFTTIRKDVKAFTRGDFVIAGSGSYRMIQLLRYKLDIKAPAKDQDIMEFMVLDFVDALRKCYVDAGALEKYHSTQEWQSGSFLVGYRGRLFKIQGDFQVGESSLPYDTVGAGQDVAIGSLFSTHGTQMSSERRLEMALRAASTFNNTCQGPFTSVGMGWDKHGRAKAFQPNL